MRGQETDLEMSRRHVQQSAAHVARQREIVARLRASGQPTEAALQLLAAFGATQQHQEHLARLEGGPPAVAAERGD